MKTIIIKRSSSIVHDPNTAKHALDAAAGLTAFGAFFHAIPWPEIAAFLSVIWLVTRIYEYVMRKIRGESENGS